MKNEGNVATSVIGSYPVEINNQELMNYYYNQVRFSWDGYIKKAVGDMLRAGVDFVSDGQTRDSFVNIYIRGLKGCRIRDRPEVVDKIVFDESITVRDQKMVKDYIPSDKNLIGVVTGPFTLSQSVTDFFYNDDKELAFDFASALNKEVKALEPHVDMVSVDEPFFSNIIPGYAVDLIEAVLKNTDCISRLHVCGNVGSMIPQIIEIPVDVLSHEFKNQPSLFECFKEYSFSQKICLGCVRSDDAKVESVDEIKDHVLKGLDIFGSSLSQIAPDCGLKMLPVDVAFQKLKNLSKVGEIINEQF
ncbi:MAG: hypothetical protein V5A64_04875 [Candidatus Thermoplasmatota archaeon]